jgi:hypothetical protein
MLLSASSITLVVCLALYIAACLIESGPGGERSSLREASTPARQSHIHTILKNAITSVLSLSKVSNTPQARAARR